MTHRVDDSDSRPSPLSGHLKALLGTDPADGRGNDFIPHPAVPYVDFKAAGLGSSKVECGGWRPHGMAFKEL